MELSRYTHVDAYTLEELRRRYQLADAGQRIALIRELYEDGVLPPYDIMAAAATDERTEVRQWVARHARHLDYREPVWLDGDSDNVANGYRYPDRDLFHKLRHDKDPFVRACLYENPSLFDHYMDADWQNDFNQAGHMERLAMVRNPKFQAAHALVAALFDPDDTTLGAGNLAEHDELVTAMLISRQAQAARHRQGSSLLPDLWDARFFSQLWRLISKWPAESHLRGNIYLFVGTTIRTKAGLYRQCHHAAFRAEMLHRADKDDHDIIQLGMTDPDDRCRFLAYRKTQEFSIDQFDQVLRGNDVHALLGLADNCALTLEQLEEVRTRLFTLGAHEQARWATETIERKKQLAASQNPAKVFATNQTPVQLDQKVNILGGMLLDLQQQLSAIQESLAQIQRAQRKKTAPTGE